MPDQKISELPAAGAISAGDLVPIVQSDGGSPETLETVQTTVGDLFSFGGDIDPAINGFRFSLHPTDPEAYLLPVVPTATDHATNDTVTLPAGHNYCTGVRCTVSATVGGLTAGTLYYLSVSSNTASFHTTLANAIAVASKVNLSADITSTIIPSGIEALSGFLHPYRSDRIALWDGSRWVLLNSNDSILPVTFPSLTAGDVYDFYPYYNAGAIGIEASTIWSGATTQGDTLIRKNGVWVKSGALTRRAGFTIKANATNTVIDDRGGVFTKVGAKRFAWNYSNQIPLDLLVFDEDTWSYTSATVRQADGNAGNKVEVVSGVRAQIDLTVKVSVSNNAAAVGVFTGIGIDVTTLTDVDLASASVYGGGAPVNNGGVDSVALFNKRLMGYHALNWLEASTAGGTTFWIGQDPASPFKRGGIAGTILG